MNNPNLIQWIHECHTLHHYMHLVFSWQWNYSAGNDFLFLKKKKKKKKLKYVSSSCLFLTFSYLVSVLICFSQNTVRAFFMRFLWFPFGVFHVSSLAEKTASRAVSLFLHGDVSFLPDNSFPSHIQLLKVCTNLDFKFDYCKTQYNPDSKKGFKQVATEATKDIGSCKTPEHYTLHFVKLLLSIYNTK